MPVTFESNAMIGFACCSSFVGPTPLIASNSSTVFGFVCNISFSTESRKMQYAGTFLVFASFFRYSFNASQALSNGVDCLNFFLKKKCIFDVHKIIIFPFDVHKKIAAFVETHMKKVEFTFVEDKLAHLHFLSHFPNGVSKF